MKKLLLPLLLLPLLLSGCLSGIKVPPGSCATFTEVDNYGPVSVSVKIIGVSKQTDGTFNLAHYDGQVSYLGFGPHTIIEGLTIDSAGNAAAPVK